MATAAVAPIPIDQVSSNRPSLLQLLTEQILQDKISVDEAREIVLRREFYRKNPIQEINYLPNNVKELEQIETQMILRAMRRNNCNMRRTAADVGMNNRTLWRRLKEIGYEF